MRKIRKDVFLVQTYSAQQYTISFDTFILQPITSDQNRGIYTKVIEREQEFIAFSSPMTIVRESLKSYGTNYNAALKSAQQKLDRTHKVPIVIAHDFGLPLVFMPTLSATSMHNIWVALHSVDSFNLTEDGFCSLTLENGQDYLIDVTCATFYRQFSLSSLLKNTHQKQLRKLNRLFDSK